MYVPFPQLITPTWVQGDSGPDCITKGPPLLPYKKKELLEFSFKKKDLVPDKYL